MLEKLRVGDKLVCLNENLKISKIVSISIEETVYNLELLGNCEFYANHI